MSAPATPPSPPATVVSEGDRAYVGYRRRGAATVRLPSGVYVTVPSSSDRELAEAVLAARAIARCLFAAPLQRVGLIRSPRGAH